MNFSTVSALSEIFVTIGVLYVIWQNVTGKGFNWKLIGAVIVFEFTINMLYMMHRLNMHTDVASGEPRPFTFLTAIMAGHGILSLLVFILLVILSVLAYLDFRKNRFYFKDRPVLTKVFVSLWLVSVLSGEFLYVYMYK